MAIAPLDLVKRSDGAALNQSQFDGNLTDIETAVNALITLVELALEEDGKPVDDFIDEADKIADNIISLAKLAAVSEGDRGKLLRANPTTGEIETAQILCDKQTDSDAIAAVGEQAGLELSTFTFADVPAGDVRIVASAAVKWNSGAAGGTVRLFHGETLIAQVPTHFAQDVQQWLPLTFFGKLSDFAGGSLVLLMDFETSESTANLTFGVGGDGRFGRSVMIDAGL